MLPAYTVAIACASVLVLVTFHSLPGRLASTVQETWMLALLPLAGVLVVGTTGFTLVFQMWFWRDRLKAKFGQGSYQRVFLFGFGGVVLVLTLALNVYLPFSSFSPSFWQEPAASFLAMPLERYAIDIAPAIFYCRIGVAMLCLVMGFTMFARAMQAFGFDYMTLVYLYFPEESTLQDNEIYSVIRHPTYSAALTISIGGLLFTFTPYAGIFVIVLLAGFSIHVHFVEERELIHRFGESYKKYMKSTPAFFVNPRKINIFMHFLRNKPRR